MTSKILNILSIAGSDPSGGAGVQADLKTFSALGCYGMAAVTALTAQNTRGVQGVFEIPAGFVRAQIESVFDDIRVDAVKIGMAGSPDTIAAIAETLAKYKPAPIVLDPVMAAQSGDGLLSADSLAALKEKLLPLATIVTPNMPEAKILLGPAWRADLKIAARGLMDLYPIKSVLLKGGHGDGAQSTDILCGPETLVELSMKRVETKNNHGTGCTLSSALAVFLARGLSCEDAARQAKSYVTRALRHADALDVGGGHGPVHHFHEFKTPR